MKIKDFEPREYQIKISSNCFDSNSLVVLPTGLGKTKIGIIVCVERLNKFPNSKIIIVAPTRPLASQIQREFKDYTDLDSEKIVLVTGVISANKRRKICEDALIIVGTPQTINNDVDNHILDLSNVSLLILD